MFSPVTMSQPNAKKPKTYHYHDEWEDDFFFVMVKDKCVCIICNSNVALPKKANVERHFRTVHKKYEEDYPAGTALRKAKVRQLKSQLLVQQSFLTKFNSNSRTATIASFKAAEILMKHKKPFEDGEIWKNAFIKAGEVLFQNFKNKSEIMTSINNISLSRNTVMRRTEEMSENLEEILQENIHNCSFLSLQFDESTDLSDTAQLCIFIRMVFADMSATEELLTILPLKGQTRGQDVYTAFKSFINSRSFPIHKLVSITTDGAPAMVGKNVGFITLCKNDEEIPSFTSYHCIIHQQSLCSKVLDSRHVMNVAFKIVNSIRAKSLQRRQFRALLEECEADHGELLLHTDVRWLSRARFLKRFRELLSEIKQFLRTKEETYPQLEDRRWLLDLAFLCDITEKLNQLNLQLQGRHRSIVDMISSVKAFKEKLSSFDLQLRRGDLKNFTNMAEESDSEQKSIFREYADQITMLLNEFNERFADFAQLEPVVLFMSFPFRDDVNIEEIANKFAEFLEADPILLEDEVLRIKSDVFLKSRATNDTSFWKSLDKGKYPHMWRAAAYLTSFFGSTYLCESAFSSMNAIKTKHRSRLTDQHLTACLRVAISCYEPQYEKLAANMQCQVSSGASTSKQSSSQL